MTEESIGCFQPGEHFHGYVVEKLLGRGGVGAVYLVRHEVLDTFYALKILYPDVVQKDPVSLKRFLREARLATRIRHPNLVAVHDCGLDTEKGLYYLVMDYVAGGSLRQALAFEGTFSLERAVDVIAQCSRALQATQKYHVVHRDIKPENIMIQPDGLVKLVDLGIAKAQNLGDSVKTNTDSSFGTPSYISPEQAICSAQVDARADIYSLGVVFFEMLAGKCPYTGHNAAEIITQIMSDEPAPDLRDVVPGISANVAVLVRRMMIKEADRRIGSVDEVLAELAKLGVNVASVREAPVEFAAKPEVGMKTLLNGLNIFPTEDAKPSEPSERKSPGLLARILAWVCGSNGK